MHARRLVRPVGGFAALALVLAGCTSSATPEPEVTSTPGAPVEIDLSGQFPDAIAEGVVTPLSLDVDAGTGTVQEDGTVLVTGTSDGETDDSIGLLDLATGDVDWLVEEKLPDSATIIAGQLTPDVLTWSVEVEADDADELTSTLEDLGGYVFALDRESGERTVLADASGDGGTPPGTYTPAVAVQEGVAYWEGLGDDELPTIYSRPLDGSGKPTVVATDAWGVAIDRCISDKPSFYTFVEDDVTLNVLEADGTVGAPVATPAPTAEGRIVELQCGTAFVQSPYSDDGGVGPDDLDLGDEELGEQGFGEEGFEDEAFGEDDEIVLEDGDVVLDEGDIVLDDEPAEGEGAADGENLATEGDVATGDGSGDLIELVDGATVVRFRTNGVGTISAVALDETWLAIGVALDDDDTESRQLLFHRASGKVFELPKTTMTMIDLHSGYVTFGSEPSDESDAITLVGKLTAP